MNNIFNEIKSNDYITKEHNCVHYNSEITIFDKTFLLTASSEEKLKSKKEEFYFSVHEMIVSELQKITMQDEKGSQKRLK